MDAMLYEARDDQRVCCVLCAHRCVLSPGENGICSVRGNHDGRLTTRVYERLVAQDADPIEKKPLFHFYPGTRAYSIATVGCNFTCRHCQNHFISQYPRRHGGRILGDRVPASRVVAEAVGSGCRSIAFTYTEPTIALEYALDVMRAARREGLANVWVTNGYFTAEAAAEIIPLLDAANVDLKGITDRVYQEIVGGHVRPVIDSMERLAHAGVWVEVTTVVIPGINDCPDELRRTAETIRGISPHIPWHVSRFFPAHKMNDLPPTPIPTLQGAQRIGRAAGLAFVYLGNVPGQGECTHCPQCGAQLVRRARFLVRSSRLDGGVCPHCGAIVPGVWTT